MEVDFERVATLFDVLDGVAKHGTAYSYIGQAAIAELKAVEDELRGEVEPGPSQVDLDAAATVARMGKEPSVAADGDEDFVEEAGEDAPPPPIKPIAGRRV